MEESTILLVGNPNVGKSVIFSYLSGRYTVVSNYPGTTVEVSTGHTGHRKGREVVDTPGINSLFPASEDEKVTRDIILSDPGATVVQVADAKNLYRALLLTTQLAEIGCKVILVLNMMDEARQRGIEIDTAKLSSILGVEVIETVAVEKRGLSRLASVLGSESGRVPDIKVDYPEAVKKLANEVSSAIPGLGHGIFGALSLLSGDRDFVARAAEALSAGTEGTDQPAEAESAGIIDRIREREGDMPNPFSYYIAGSRKELVDTIVRASVAKRTGGSIGRRKGVGAYLPAFSIAVVTVALLLLFGVSVLEESGLFPTLPVLFACVLGMTVAGSERIDKLSIHPLSGTLILIVVIYLIYMLVGVFAAGTLVDLIENGIFARFVIPLFERITGDGFLNDLLVGEYGLISMGLSYSISIVFPIVIVFFLVFGILEDTGYFPRLTVLTNSGFRIVGVNGKATLPIVLGFGCVTMAVLASRILETRRERIIVITLLALAVPCSAQLGVMIAMISAISGPAALLIGLTVASEFIIVGHILGRLIRGRSSDFILELPPLRVPRIMNITLKTGARAKWFMKEALPYFLLATLILFVMDRTGLMRVVYAAVEPVTGRILGLPVETAAAFIVGFFRRDYGAAGLYRLWQSGQLDGNQIVVALVVMSLFLPCLASLIVMIKELGLKHAMIILISVLVISLLSGGLLNLALRTFNVQL